MMVILVIAILASLFLPAICRGYFRAKAWIWGIYAFNENRLNSFITEDGKELYWSTSKPVAWTFVKMGPNGEVIIQH